MVQPNTGWNKLQEQLVQGSQWYLNNTQVHSPAHELEVQTQHPFVLNSQSLSSGFPHWQRTPFLYSWFFTVKPDEKAKVLGLHWRNSQCSLQCGHRTWPYLAVSRLTPHRCKLHAVPMQLEFLLVAENFRCDRDHSVLPD